jgi:hypothetical protein
MHTTFHLEADELNGDFIAAVKRLFKGRKIAITIEEEEDEDWLSNNATMKAILEERIKSIEAGNLIEVNLQGSL